MKMRRFEHRGIHLDRSRPLNFIMARRWLILTVLVLLLPAAVLFWYRSSAAVGAAAEPWRRVASLPTARSEMPATVLDGLIYVPGGLGAFGRTLSVFEAYSPSEDSWRSLPSLPIGLHHSGAAAASDAIFVFGGYTGIEFKVDNARGWSYRPADGAWEEVAQMPAPRAAHALVELDGLIYAIGGVGPRADELWAYHPGRDSWQTDLPPLPTPREHLAAVALDGSLFVVGGRREGQNLAVLEVFDPASGEWRSGPDMPTARSGLAAAVAGGEIHVFGGEDLQGGGTFDTHEIFDPETEQWRSGVPSSDPRHGLAAAAIEDHLYIIGGATGAGARTVVTLTPTVDMLPANPE